MKTANELQYLAQKHGWEKGPLTRARINRMTADESDWQSRFNTEEFNRAGNEDSVKATNKKDAEAAKAQRIWQDQATPEEAEAAINEAKKFTAAYPQYICEGPNGQTNGKALLAWLQERNLLFTAQNAALAFQDLGRSGLLVLNPSVIDIGTEEEISGARLAHHPQLWKLLEPAPNAEQKSKIAEQKMSAKEYREAHKEDWRETRISDRHRESWNKAIAFFLQSRPECKSTDENLKKIGDFVFSNGLQMNPQGLEAAFKVLKSKGELELNTGAVQEGQALRYTDFGEQPRGLRLPEKESLAHKIRSMDAKTYAEWVANPTNRRAIDNQLAGVAQ